MTETEKAEQGIHPFGPRWADYEIGRFLKREKRLMDMMTEPEAAKLAEAMLLRDRPGSGDDRRICLECLQLKRGECKKGVVVPRTILQRCPTFELRGAA